MNAPRRPAPGGNAATFIALFALLALLGGLLVLSALVLPQMLGLLLVIFGFSIFAAFHYLAWGWWMGRTRPPAEEDPDG